MDLNIIHKEDCLDGLRKLPDECIDLIFTSPPYAERRKSVYGGVHHTEYVDWFMVISAELKRVLKPTGSFFINIKPHCLNGERVLYVMDLVLSLKRVQNWRFVDEFTWTKNGVPGKFSGRFKNGFEPVYHFSKEKKFTHNPYAVATPIKDVSVSRAKRKRANASKNGSGFAGLRTTSNMDKSKVSLPSNHLHIPQKSNQHTIQSNHPAVFPEELPDFFIKAFSNKGDTVLDPFMGSGTTAKMAALNGRNYIGFEVSEEYIEIANQRIETAVTQ